MFGYYSKLAWRSLLRNKLITPLMILAIAIGIGASMTMVTVIHVMKADPIPSRSGSLYYVRLDPLPINFSVPASGGVDPANDMTWPDAMGLLSRWNATPRAAMAGGKVLLWPGSGGSLPLEVSARYTTSDFFRMFDVPIEHGAAWSSTDDHSSARVVVLADGLSVKLFGDSNPIGKTLRIGSGQFRIVGVTKDWNPQPLFYADPVSKGGFGHMDQIFLPLTTAQDLGFGVDGAISSWGAKAGGNRLKSPRTSWLQFWVMLPDRVSKLAFNRLVHNYAAEQKKMGRYQRSTSHSRIYGLMGWLRRQHLAPADINVQLGVAVAFFVVCLANVVALLLAKFLRRSNEVCVRRALGASRKSIFTQFLVEAAMVGIMGGVLGVAVTELGLWSIRQRPDSYAKAVHLDASILVSTIVVAALATILAGAIPAWKITEVSPALQLKEP